MQLNAKERRRNFQRVFESKINAYRESLPELSSASILKLSIASLDENDIHQFQSCLDYDIEMFLRYAEGIDMSIEQLKAQDEAADGEEEEEEPAATHADFSTFVDILLKVVNKQSVSALTALNPTSK